MNRLGLRRKSHVLWTPNQLSDGSLYAQFDASVPSSFSLVNSGGIDYVSTWRSLIGGGSKTLTRSTSSRRPYYKTSAFSSKMCVQFDHNSSDTTNDFLDGFNVGAFNATNAPLNMFAACRQTAPTIRAATGDSTENYMTIFGFEGYPGLISLACNASGMQVGVLAGWWNNALTVQKSPQINTPNLYRNLTCFGGTIFGGLSGTWWVSTYLGNYIPRGSSSTEASNRRQYPYVNCGIGCSLRNGGSFAYPFQGELYELLLITGNVTEFTKIKILEYLRAKWGP